MMSEKRYDSSSRQASSVSDFFTHSEPKACGGFLRDHVGSLLYPPDVLHNVD